MKTIYHAAESRGAANHGWLNAKHSFSFAGYFDADRIHFGALRVLNDDTVAPAMGFGMHPHNNMEIITIPLSGALRHKDNMGSTGVIGRNEVQVMSAGTGIMHSEVNASSEEAVSLLQIWVFPKEVNIPPRYDQKRFDPQERQNKFQVIVSPSAADSLRIHQDATFSLADLSAGKSLPYSLKKGFGLYLFVIKGEVQVEGKELKERDALGIWDTEAAFNITASQDAEILAMEVPMEV